MLWVKGGQTEQSPQLNLTTCKVLIFMEGGKPENPEKNPRSTGETNYNSASHEFRSKLEEQPGAKPRWSPIQL